MKKKIGALWRHKDKQGKVYFTGTVEIIAGIKTNVVCFQKEAKQGGKPNQPAYEVYISEPAKKQSVSEEPNVELIKVKTAED